MGAPIWTHLTPSYVLFLPVVFIVLVTFTVGLPLLLGGYFYMNRDNLYTPVVMINSGLFTSVIASIDEISLLQK